MTDSLPTEPPERCLDIRSDGWRCQLEAGHGGMHEVDISPGRFIKWPNFDPPPIREGAMKTPEKCARCGHPPQWHRHDDADEHDITDPDCPFRCIGYDVDREFTGPPPPESVGTWCPVRCPDFVKA